MDAEKTFDRIAWDYMEATLRLTGLGDTFCKIILALYADPTARLRVNGTLSSQFHITNCPRQGSPLSPVIVVISLEPLLRKIRELIETWLSPMGLSEYLQNRESTRLEFT